MEELGGRGSTEGLTWTAKSVGWEKGVDQLLAGEEA